MRDVCLVIVTLTLVSLAGWMVANDIRNRREIEDFRARLAQRVAFPQWQAEPVAPEVEG